MLTIGSADMVFLALDGKRAKLIRSYLGLSMPIYATSLVHTSDAPLANYELNGVYFVDMPWLLTPDHPAVLSYERPDPAQANIEYQRFYALGIDAYRIAQSLLKSDSEFQPLDGVTGYITLDRDRRLRARGRSGPVRPGRDQGAVRSVDAMTDAEERASAGRGRSERAAPTAC